MTTAQEIKDVKQDIKDLKKMIAQEFEGESNGHSRHAFSREEIQLMANRAGKSVRGFLNDKRDQLGVAKIRTEDTIKAHPFTVTAAAVASGMLLGALLRRK